MERALPFIIGILVLAVAAGGWVVLSGRGRTPSEPPAVAMEQAPPPAPEATPAPAAEPPPAVEPEPATAATQPAALPEEPAAEDPERPISVKIAGSSFVIPAGYFEELPEGEQAARIVLKAGWPDFQRAAGTGPDVRILIKKPTAKDNLNYLEGLNLRLLKADKPVDTVAGLEHYTSPPDLNLTRDDLYVETEGGRTKSLMTCRPGEGPDATCSHFFQAGDLLVMVIFGKAELENWQKVQEGTLSLLKGFEQGPGTGAP